MSKRTFTVILSVVAACIIGYVCYYFSTRVNRTLRKQLTEMQGQKVNLGFQQGEVIYNGQDTVLANDSRRTLVLFVDSMSCSSCFLNHMLVYYDINDSITDAGGRMVVVLHPKDGRDAEIRHKVRIEKYPFWCIIDKEGEFIGNNPDLPDNKLLHSFTLDEDDRIMLVGDPSSNTKIKQLLMTQLKN